MSDKEIIMKYDDYHKILKIIHKMKMFNTNECQDQEDISNIEDLLNMAQVFESDEFECDK